MTRRSVADARATASTRRLAVITSVSLLIMLGAAALVGGQIAGADGARSASLGVGMTATLFGGGLLGLVRSPRGGASLAPVLAAFSIRVVLYAAALALVTRAEWVHGPSLVAATAASVALMLAVELVALAREPVAELEPLRLPDRSGGTTGLHEPRDDRGTPDDDRRDRDGRARRDGA